MECQTPPQLLLRSRIWDVLSLIWVTASYFTQFSHGKSNKDLNLQKLCCYIHIHLTEEVKCSHWNLLSTKWGKDAHEQESAQEMELHPDLDPFKSLKEEIYLLQKELTPPSLPKAESKERGSSPSTSEEKAHAVPFDTTNYFGLWTPWAHKHSYAIIPWKDLCVLNMASIEHTLRTKIKSWTMEMISDLVKGKFWSHFTSFWITKDLTGQGEASKIAQFWEQVDHKSWCVVRLTQHTSLYCC